jgi:hypothetical protein
MVFLLSYSPSCREEEVFSETRTKDLIVSNMVGVVDHGEDPGGQRNARKGTA